jgi:hypothetical protein
MKRTLLSLLLLTFSIVSFSQVKNKELISLAKTYRSYHFSNTPSQKVFDELNTIGSDQLKTSAKFISELIRSNNQIATKKYLTKPDTNTLKNLFIIRSINWNLHEADPVDNNELIDSLSNDEVNDLELLACYYGMVFTSVGNKNRPLNMSQINLDINDYNLESDEEKGVFFLKSMNTFGTYIWGYMNVVKPPNYKKALEVINNYPKYNGEPYYQFLDLNFRDFNLTIDKREPKKSFKEYFINKYLNTLLYHSMCLSQKKKHKEEKEKVMLGSIMKNDSYYKYSETPEVFEKIFKKVEY